MINTDVQGNLILDLYTTWCGPCKKISPIMDSLAVDLQGKVIVQKIDIEKEVDFANKMGIVSVPTILFYKDGKVVKRLAGFVSKDSLMNHAKEVFSL